jgi:NAD(P)H-dependent flavin oxidoreductase YrpB (nitropropane dioxygenase family)
MAQEAEMTTQDVIEEGKAYEAAYKGDIESGAVLLGQSIGIIDRIKEISEIINEIVEDAEKHLKKTQDLIK